MLSHSQNWRTAWVESAYGGPGAATPGYWRTESPPDHFSTAAASTSLLSELVLAALTRRPWIGAVVDLGAGTGALASAVAVARRDLDVYAVDVRDRPPALDDDVAWCRDLFDVDTDRWTTGEAEVVLATLDRPTLVLAVEWLDDLPLTVGARGSGGVLHEVDVDDAGVESTGAPLTDQDRAWTDRWWPDGRRVEVGLTRDRAWADALGRLRLCGGAGLVVDYGHRRADRPTDGSLAAYARGERRPLLPSSRLNLTAHVAVDSLLAAGEEVGARTVAATTLAQVAADHPGVPSPDPLAALVQRSERGVLSAPGVWGGQHWLLQEIAPPDGRSPTPSVVD